MNALSIFCEEYDLSIEELAKAVSHVVSEDYGKHNYKKFKQIINEILCD